MSLTAEPISTLPSLIERVTRLYGQPLVVSLPPVTPDGDHADAFDALLRQVQHANVVVFPAIRIGSLDAFFHLRLAEILKDRPPLRSLSVVALSPETGPWLAGGFADRFRAAWPFERCVFVTDDSDAAVLSSQIGLPVGGPEADPEILYSEARAGQKIALQLQEPWPRCGSTTAFENQIEGLVKAGFLTIRLFASGNYRRGPTLDARLKTIIPENSANANAHINLIAIPDQPPIVAENHDPVANWASRLDRAASCKVSDAAATEAGKRADAVIANHLEAVGLAIHLAPRARLLLHVHDDRAAAARTWAQRQGYSEAETEAEVAAAAQAQARVLAIPDICTHVSIDELARLGPQTQRRAAVLPRIYVAVPLSFNDAGELAADIPELANDPGRLAERQSPVEQAEEAVQGGRDYPDVLRSIPLPSTHVTRRRLAEWASLTAAAMTREKSVHHFSLDTPFLMTGGKWDHQVLIHGWHDAEPWGRWTDGAEGALQIELAAPLDEPLRLEFDVVPSAVASPLTLCVDAEQLGAIEPRQGSVGWDLPPELTAGKTRFAVALHAAATASPDGRVVGIGVCSVRLVCGHAHPCDPGRYIPIRSDATPRDMLLAGWHPAEDWGCWSNGTTASFELTFARPLHGAYRLELNLIPPAAGGTLTLSVNERALPPVAMSDGMNRWMLPPEVTEGQRRLLIVLSVPETYCPKAAGTAEDDRSLGVGLRGIKLVGYVPGTCAVGRPLLLAPPMDLDGVLLEGWHPPEGWGTWTNAPDATMRLTLGEAMSGSFALEIEFAARALETILTVSVNGFELPAVRTSGGLAVWRLPASCTDGQRDLVVGLHVADTFRPADLGDSRDDRALGIGVRSVTLTRESAAICPIGPKVTVSSRLGESGMLVDGWHRLEPWGCWTAGADATMVLQFGTLLEGNFVLQMDLVPPLVDRQVDLAVNGIALEPLDVADGLNEWFLPQDCTEGQSALSIGVHVERPARPADIKESSDDRVLGLGLRTFRIVPVS
nr:hypothetical protein [uncultured Rhodopila sp.]